MIYLDYKVTVWRRAKFFDESRLEEIVKAVEADNYYRLVDEADDDVFLHDTEEMLDLHSNDWCPTAEVLDINANSITTNSCRI